MEESQRQYRTLILAGLLHDIGKLLIEDPEERERAKQVSGSGSSERTSADHWVLGADFLRRDEIAAPFSNFEIDFEQLCFAVRWHHHYREGTKAKQAIESLGDRAADYVRARDCITEGDGLSSGERSKEIPKSEQEKIEFSLGLQPIFANLNIGRAPQGNLLRYPPEVLDPAIAFPGEFPTGRGREATAYRQQVYEPLVAELKKAFRYALDHARDVDELERSIYSLLERYMWAAPSDMRPRREPRDVSLFDHERTTCALAAAVYIWQEFAPEQERDHPRFAFIKGDVSGVQDFIYSVANVGPGGVAKRLRARSSFITALNEVVAHRLREDLVPGYPLPVAAQIFAGGAQFVLLAPDLEVVHQRLRNIEREINAWLWRELQGDLAFVFGTATATDGEFDIRGKRTICDVLDDLEQSLAEAKQRRLGILLQDENGWLEDSFKWEERSYSPHGDCPSCRRLPAQAGEGAAVDAQLCPRCKQDRILSEQIVRAHYIAYFKAPEPPSVKQGVGEKDAERLQRSVLSFFGDEKHPPTHHVVLLSDLDDLGRLDGRPYQLDGFGYEKPTPEGPALVRHFANYVPRFKEKKDLEKFCTPGRGCVQISYDDDEMCGILVRPDGSDVQEKDFPILQTFGCISAAAAEWEDGSLGTQLLGVLRADVDNLGWLFRRGIGEVKSLSRLATLSRMTDLFFSGWVNQVLTKPPPGKRYDRIYTVYSGGDDLCLVGPWDVVIDFARHMAKEFQRYVAYNPNVTLSAAVAVTKPKFPIATSARAAYELLTEAKNAGRNRLNLFGVISRWSKEPDEWAGLDQRLSEQLDDQRKHAMLLLDELWPWAELLDEELRQWREARPVRYPVSTGFAHRLLSYAEMARMWEQEERISAEDMLYMARLAYDLGRNVIKSDAVPEETKRRLSQMVRFENRVVMAGMRLPITYALYRNRERSREQ